MFESIVLINVVGIFWRLSFSLISVIIPLIWYVIIIMGDENGGFFGLILIGERSVLLISAGLLFKIVPRFWGKSLLGLCVLILEIVVPGHV